MKRNVYLSFLGTNDYEPCIYYHGNDQVENVRFIQEATLSFFCRNWSRDDRIYIFTTAEACEKNWVDDGQQIRIEKSGLCEGLQTRIQKLGLKATVEAVQIPIGNSEDEIWNIFQVVFDKLEPGDEVVFDITHAFRSIPMLAIVVLNYAKVLKNVSLKGIFYGAFEVLGPLHEVRKKPMHRRRAPVFDLSTFDALLEWSVAMDRFLKSGDAGHINNLATHSMVSIIKTDKENRQGAIDIKSAGEKLADFTAALSTTRAQALAKKTENLKQKLENCREIDLLKPFVPLFEKIIEIVEPYDENDVNNGLLAVKWCINHGLIQQGYTLLLETLITFFVQKAGGDIDNISHRSTVTAAVNFIQMSTPESEWKGNAADYKDMTKKIMAILQKNKEIVNNMEKLREDRNNLNHAGYGRPDKSPKKFEENLRKYYDNANDFIRFAG